MSDVSSEAPNTSRRGLLPLWIARDLSALGNWVILIALLAWTYRIKESAALVSILMLGWLLLPFLLGPLATWCVKASNARVVGVVAQLARAAALAPLLQVADNNDFRLVVTAVAVASLPAAFARASHRSMLEGLPDSGNATSLQRALFSTRVLTLILGPYAGTLIYGVNGVHACAIAVLVALVLSAFLMLLAGPSSATVSATLPRRTLSGTIADLKDGLNLAFSLPSMRPVTTVRMMVALVAGGLMVAQVAFMVWGLFTDTENMGAVLATEGLGVGIGAMAYFFARGRFPASTLVATGLAIMAFGQFGFAISSVLKGALALSGAIGLGKGMLLLSLGSALSNGAPVETGRPVSANEGLDFAVEAAALLSFIVMGPLADSITPRFTIVLISIVMLVLALYAFGSVPDRQTVADEGKAAGEEVISSPLIA